MLAPPPLLHGSENWTIKAREASRRIITAAKMKHMRKTAGYTWTYHKRNTDIAKELNLTPVSYKIQDCRRKWMQHVNGMLVTLPRVKKTTPQKHEGDGGD